MANAIEVEHLSKQYLINSRASGQPQSLREVIQAKLLLLRGKSTKREALASSAREGFWALHDVSFNVEEGERIAIIGSNGAGKSTLLKILSRITEPSLGEVRIRGKVASLLEVGTGFHPELTGRENIYLNGAILGMRRAEIQKKFDTIVQFSGVERFIDTPVKHYSSGMYVRLAFSVSAWLDPDILIVDEVLSVGDQAFQKRCSERIKEMTGDGRTVIFVSHSMSAVKSMCEKALYLKHGEVVSFTAVEDATTDYLRSVLEDSEHRAWHKPLFSFPDEETDAHIQCADYAVCVGGEIRTEGGDISANVNINQAFQIVLRYKLLKDTPFPIVPNFHFYDEGGNRFFISFPQSSSPTMAGEYAAICNIEPFQFNTGRFSVMTALSSYEMAEPLHFAIENALRFEVSEPANVDPRRHGWSGALPGLTRLRLDWTYKPTS